MAHGWLKAFELFTWPGLCHVCNVWILPSKSWPAVLALWIWKKWHSHFGHLWHSVTHFGILWPSSSIPHESSFHFAQGVYDNLWIQSECSQCPCLMHEPGWSSRCAVSCNSTVRYSAYVCDLCVFTRCALYLYFWLWEISSLPGCLLLVGLCCSCCQLQEKWSHVSTEGPLISHHPTGRSLWIELF